MPSLSYLAILIGGLAILSRLPGIVYPKAYAKFAKALMKEKITVRMFSAIPFLLSLSILVQKYDFTKDWETVMSGLGWLLLLGSIYLAWWPKKVEGVLKKILKSEAETRFFCLVGVGLGVALFYLGLNVY